MDESGGCQHHPDLDEAAVRALVADRRANGNARAYARRCSRCKGWRVGRAGEQGKKRPTANTWWRVYKYRMRNGLEHCRMCGRRDDLTFDHIVPYSVQRSWSFSDVTILCRPHNVEKRDVAGTLPSLAQEEAAAPPDRQWSKIGRELYSLPPRKRYPPRTPPAP
jgi:5-methylcytosine-specific restriction endonuclease McrA